MNDRIRTLVDDHVARHPEDAEHLAALRTQLESAADITSRSNMAGHVTASALVLDRTKTRALLIGHLALGVEIPPGGHMDPGETPHETAIRELGEETGVTNTRPAGGKPFLLDIDTHPIPARPSKNEGPHQHHDMMWLELTDDDHETAIQDSEISAARWAPLEEMAGTPGRNGRIARRVLSMPPGALA